MENENKTEEVKTEKNEEKIAPAAAVIKEGKKIKEKCCAMWKNNKKTIIAIIVAAVLIGGSFAFKAYWSKIDVGPDVAKAKIQTFIDKNAPAGTKVDIKSVTKEGDLYKIVLNISGQEIPLYVTRDGKKLIQQTIDLDQKPDTQNADTQAAATKTEADQKAAVPTVDLFVMSYCPYGLQMERGILPVVETLGSKIKFNLKFVGYTLHGQKEVDENVNQYCIEKLQPAKLDAYLKCFWKNSSGASATCMKSVGINTAQIATCVTSANTQFSPTEKDFSINGDEAAKFGVQGSPTLVVNGTTVSSGRDSASILKAVCSGFTTQPKECSANLSATSPAAGFDDQAAASSGSSGANCSTPQQ
jgi:hypothetical protein